MLLPGADSRRSIPIPIWRDCRRISTGRARTEGPAEGSGKGDPGGPNGECCETREPSKFDWFWYDDEAEEGGDCW